MTSKRNSIESVRITFGAGLGAHLQEDSEGGYAIATGADCVLPDTEVSVLSELHVASRRKYEGEIIEITTTLGYKLSGTPNHPVLTNRGWIGLGFLKEGDYVVSSRLSEGDLASFGVVEPNPDYVKSSISKVFEFSALSGVVQRKAGTPMDFHGDGQETNIDIVTLPSKLKYGIQPTLDKPRSHHLFPDAHFAKSTLMTDSLIDKPGWFMSISADTLTSLFSPGSSPFLSMSLKHTSIDFSLSMRRDPCLNKCHFDSLMLKAQVSRNTANRSTLSVLPNDFCRVDWLEWSASSPINISPRTQARDHRMNTLSIQGNDNCRAACMVEMGQFPDMHAIPKKPRNLLVSKRNSLCSSFDQALSAEDSSYLSLRNAKTLREYQNPSPWPIGLDEIVQIGRRFYSGHVYNLETETGWYLANNIVSHNCRFGEVIPGPLEVVDMTGIAAGYYFLDQIKHNGVNIQATTNGTDTRVYREEASAWVLKATFAGVVAGSHCLLSFHDGTNSTLVCFLTASVAWQYSTDDGTNWTASTRAGNSKFGNMGIVRQNARVSADVLYVRNPNETYTSTSMVNGGAAADTGSTIGDGSAQTYFNSVVEATDGTNVVIFGMRNAGWSMDSSGATFRMTRFVEDPPADAGGTSDRRNFEAYAVRGGRIYYIVSDYELWEYYQGVWNEDMAPYHQAVNNGADIPRLHLPINAVVNAGGWIVVALGDKNSATNRVLTFSPGGTNLLINTLGVTSELYVGAPQGDSFVWHGSILTCTDPLRGLWFDPDDSYLYLASGDAELINEQSRRCYFATSNPLTAGTTSVVTLNNGAITVETGIISGKYPFDAVVPISIKCIARGLASSAPSLAIAYRFVGDFDTSSGYTTLETFVDSQRAMSGTRFPRMRSFATGRLRFTLTGTGTTYGILKSIEVILAPFEESKLPAMAF